MAKFGKENFIIEEIEQCDNSKLNERERYWIDYYDSYNNGYNLTLGGAGNYKNKKPIYCYTLKGNLYKKYPSIFEASQELKVIPEVLREVLNDRNRISSLGFQWAYEEDLSRIKDLSKLDNFNGIKTLTLQYDINGNFLNFYESLEEAAQKTGVQNSGIIRCINKQLIQAGGYQWTRGFKGEEFPQKISPLNISQRQLRKGQTQKVLCIKNNIQILYNSLSEASRKEKFSRHKITDYCDKYPKPTPEGIQFKYYEE